MEKREAFVSVNDGGDADDEEDNEAELTAAEVASPPVSEADDEEEGRCCFGRRMPGNMRWVGISIGRGGGGRAATAVDKSILHLCLCFSHLLLHPFLTLILAH